MILKFRSEADVVMIQRLILLVLALALVSCSSSPSPPTVAPSIKGVLPEQTIWDAAEALGNLQWASGPQDERVFTFSDGKLICKGGVIKKVIAESLDVGSSNLKAGASGSDVEAVWGKPASRFDRDGRKLTLYQFRKYRYELEWSADKLKQIEITKEPRPLGPGSNPFGKGVLGDDLGNDPGLKLNGIAIGWTKGKVEDVWGKPTPSFSGDSSAFGPESTAIVGFTNRRAIWIIGDEFKQEEKTLVKIGMSGKKAAKGLSAVARLRQYSGAHVTYTFLNLGEVCLGLDQTNKVVSIEWYIPKKK